MIKHKTTMKQSLSLDDIIAFVEKVVSGYFQEELDENGAPTGEVIYTPYFRDQMISALFVQYAVNGLEFEEGENPYVSIVADPELMSMYDKWKARCSASAKKPNLYYQMEQIENLIDDKLEIEKKKYIQDAGINKEIKALLRGANAFLNVQRQALERQNEFNNRMSIDEQVEFIKKMNGSDISAVEIAKEAVKMYNKSKEDTDEKVIPIVKE